MQTRLTRRVDFSFAELWSSAQAALGGFLLGACIWMSVNFGYGAQHADRPAVIAGSLNEAFVVFGKVCDAEGKPLSGVEVWASCGNGTLLRTGAANTEADGTYRLSFKPGMLMGAGRGVGPLHVGFQAATVSARKSGYFIQNLGRDGNLAMTDSNETLPGWSTNFAGVVHAQKPYQLDFTLAKASSIQVQLAEPDRGLEPGVKLCLTGDKLPPSSSVLACKEMDGQGQCLFDDVPVGYEWRFEASWREGDSWKTIRSKPLHISSPALKHVRITPRPESIEIRE